MASYGMNDVKNGMKILVNNDPCVIVDTEYVKPGKGQAFTRVKYRNIKNGRVQEITMKSPTRSRRRTSWIPTCSSCIRTASSGTSCSRRRSSRSRPTRMASAKPPSGSRARSPAVTLFVILGEGEVVAGKERRRVKKGDLVVVPRKVRRGVKAKTDMVVLHVVSPSPTKADHGDMAGRIARGEFELPA